MPPEPGPTRSTMTEDYLKVIWKAEEWAAEGSPGITTNEIAATLGDDGHAWIERELSAVPAHAERRVHELGSVASYLDELKVPHAMTDATRAELLRIASEAGARGDLTHD